jgi:hypothetical protein
MTSTELAPLFEAESQPGIFRVNLRTGVCVFQSFSESRRDDPFCIGFPVNNLLSRTGMDTIQRLVKPYVANLCSNSFVVEGALPDYNPRGRRAYDAVAGICQDVGKRPEMLDCVVSAEVLVKSLPLDKSWPENMDVEQASMALTSRMAGEGKKVVGDMRRAFCQKLVEEVGEGRELPPRKQRFMEEEMQSLKFNPLHQKPIPGGF